LVTWIAGKNKIKKVDISPKFYPVWLKTHVLVYWQSIDLQLKSFTADLFFLQKLPIKQKSMGVE